MRHLKYFFEAVIKPFDFDEEIEILKSSNNWTIETLNSLFKDLNTEFVDIDYFKSKLKTKKEIELVPTALALPFGIRFGAYNVHTKKIYICVEDKFIDSINSKNKEVITLLKEILRHESIHKQQNDRQKVETRMLEKSPLKPKEYFGSPLEIMAYAQSFIDQCHNRGLSGKDILDALNGKKIVSWVQNIYDKMPEKVRKKFYKYVYQYINE
jgi:hypothetical protein